MLLSVIMPIFNAEKYIEESISSILNQSYKNFELILINDGSTDNSLQIIEDFKNTDPRIKLINRENRGLISSLNEAIGIATGKYIARMDADDISHPKRFEHQLDLIEREKADICGSNFNILKKNKLIPYQVPTTDEAIQIYMCSRPAFAHGSIIMRKSFLESNNIIYGQLNFKYAEDYSMWINMFHHGAKFINHPDYLYTYRDNNHSLIKTNNAKIWSETKNISKIFIEKNQNQIIQAIATRAIEKNISSKEYMLLILAQALISQNIFSPLLYFRFKMIYHFMKGMYIYIRRYR